MRPKVARAPFPFPALELDLDGEQLRRGARLIPLRPKAFAVLCYAAGLDPRVSTHAYAALMFWFLGYPDCALQESHRAVQIAQSLDSPFNVSGAVDFTCLVHMLQRNIQATREQAEQAISIATQYGFLYWQSACTLVWGHTLVEQGEKQEGIDQIRQGLASSLATGAKTGQAVWRALLASAYGKNSLPAEGLAMIEETLAFVNASGERMFEAEIYRLKGTLTLQSQISPRHVTGKSKTRQGKSKETSTQHPTLSTQAQAEAEACFLQAITIARQQQAKSLELRAVLSLSRLWQQQGKTTAARQMLAKIYGWFTEGFDTPDLQEAKALLRELA